MSKTLIIVAAQINFCVGAVMENAEKVIIEAQRAINELHADCVVFPEMTLSGYPAEDLVFRADFLRQCQKALAKIQQAALPVTLIIGYPVQINQYTFNQAAIIHHGEIIATYNKQELPNYTVFDEKRYFYPGNSPCVFDLNGVKIGVLICEDLWLPRPVRQTVDVGAQLIIVLNASPFDHNKAQIRQALLVERAHEVQKPIIYVNLIGGQDELVFDGGSMVIDQQGQCCAQAAHFQEELMPVTVTVDVDDAVQVVSGELPATSVHRNSVHVQNIYQALVLGVRDYIGKNHFPGAILGLSGGIDSALTLAIVTDAIGAENVTTIMMPSRYTREMSKTDALAQCELLGVKHLTIDIEPIFQAFLHSLAEPFANLPLDVTEENLQARIRGTLLMAFSNKKGLMVLTTGNKSEMSVGYATLYGDMAGGFGVLKDVTKTMVYHLAEYRNQLSPAIPQRVIARPPSAELSKDQLDQDSLPPYSILDEILVRYIELDQSAEVIAETGIDRAVIDKVIKMINRNEYKRRQAPPGIRITQRAFGKDRRYPITSGWKA
jgi:NAD+ synthase (glutamine-hydrolysing)